LWENVFCENHRMFTGIHILTGFFMIAGLTGTLLPFIPGSPLIFGEALLYAWHTDFIIVGWGTLVALLILTVLGEDLEKLSSLIGARIYGASRWGLIGVFLGGFAGWFIGGIIGLIMGPFLGAIVLEMIPTRDANLAFQAGIGAFLGLLCGMAGKFVIACIMIGVFLWQAAG